MALGANAPRGARMRVKICGLTRPEDVAAAVNAGADAVGFVLAVSKRRVSPAQVAMLVRAVPAHVETVAVFRTPNSEVLARVLPHVTCIQADASWDPAVLPAAMNFLPVFADGVDLPGRLADWSSSRLAPALGRVLVDSANGGGSGVPADWSRVPAGVVLAGGLRPENVSEAISRTNPVAVDVSSGVETAPGIKDPARIAAFVAAAREGGCT